MGKELSKDRESTDRRMIRPASSICENEGEILLRLEMPGVSKKNVEMKIEDNELSIHGSRTVSTEPRRYILHERREGDYLQTFTLDGTIDQGRIDAAMDAGVLLVTLPLRESSKPRRIEIKAG